MYQFTVYLNWYYYIQNAEQLKTRGYYRDLKDLIETMYRENDNTKVTIVTHSLGGPVSLYFLTSISDITQEWKDKYINSFIPLSGAWSGGNEILYTEINGRDFFEDVDFISTGMLTKPILRSFQSMVWLLPHASVWNNTVIVTTPSRSYTANDYEALFRDIGFPEGYTMYQGILDINKGWPAPNVPTHCFYGVGVPTELEFIYDRGFPDAEPVRIINGDGDGDVNIESSLVCHHWANSQYPFEYTEFSGVGHRQILKNEAVLRAIENIVAVTN